MSNGSKKQIRPVLEGYRGNGVQIPTYSKPAPMPKKVLSPVPSNSTSSMNKNK